MAETSEQDRQRDEAGREAIRRLSGPVKGRVMLAQVFTVLSALLSFAPYLALVWLGDLFLAGEGPLAQADASKGIRNCPPSRYGVPLAAILSRSRAYYYAFCRHEAALRHPQGYR